ncbi:MAG: hypothetical protein ACJ8C4_18070 [Gemmataceae bacterium]
MRTPRKPGDQEVPKSVPDNPLGILWDGDPPPMKELEPKLVKPEEADSKPKKRRPPSMDSGVWVLPW